MYYNTNVLLCGHVHTGVLKTRTILKNTMVQMYDGTNVYKMKTRIILKKQKRESFSHNENKNHSQNALTLYMGRNGDRLPGAPIRSQHGHVPDNAPTMQTGTACGTV